MYTHKRFGEVSLKGLARDGLVLENNERLPICTPFSISRYPLAFTKIHSENKYLQSKFTLHTRVHAHTHTHADYEVHFTISVHEDFTR
jgi:hypothetical protein